MRLFYRLKRVTIKIEGQCFQIKKLFMCQLRSRLRGEKYCQMKMIPL